MQENFLHYLWRTRRFNTIMLQTTQGETLEIQDFGEHNSNAGPDFLNATIRLGDIIWVGNIEMHVKSSDWLMHGHQHDEAYKNVILHVVFEDDLNSNSLPKDTLTQGEIPPLGVRGLPCLELKNRIPEGIYQKYWALLHNETWIPCQNQFFTASSLTKTMWYDRLLVERLEKKTEAITEALARNKNDWEETFYQFITRNFGVAVNTEPMEWLARSLPHLTLAKHKNNLFQLEALLFGQSGLIEKEFKDEYPNILKKEHAFLSHKHKLKPINGTAWKFSRMRPAAFPTIRLAQLADLVHQSSHLFSKVLDIETITDIENLFSVKTSPYWTNHYVFDTPSVTTKKTMGKDTIDLIIINTIVPFLFHYGKTRKEDRFKDRAFQFLDDLKPENNSITEGWKNLGEMPKSAFQTQALIHLKKEYCDKKRCLACAIGNTILNAQ
jgi:Protein of unknown function (DUF2851)